MAAPKPGEVLYRDIEDAGGYMPCPECGRVGETCERCLASIKETADKLRSGESLLIRETGQLELFHE